MKSENDVKDQVIKSLEFQLESILELTSSKQNDQKPETLHQTKKQSSSKPIQGNGHHSVKPNEKPKQEIEEKKQSEAQASKSSKPKALKPKSRGIIGIIGGGTIGTQLAALLSFKKYKIVLIDGMKSMLEKSKKIHRQICDSYLQQNIITKQDIDAIKIVYSDNMDDFKKYHDSMHTVIDTSHDYHKKLVIQKLIKLIDSKCVIITTSKQKCITEISSYLHKIAPNFRENLIGINLLWFELSMIHNKCIEIIPSWNTSHSVIEKCKKLVSNDLGKEYIVIQDHVGFVSNRLMAVQLNEAFTILENKIASTKDIDKIQRMMNDGMKNLNVGPFAIADKIGLDTIVQILDELYREYGQQKYVANSMLKQYVRAGKFGRKSGVGVYSYNVKKKENDNKQTQKIQK